MHLEIESNRSEID